MKHQTMTERVKKYLTHHKNIPAAVYCMVAMWVGGQTSACDLIFSLSHVATTSIKSRKIDLDEKNGKKEERNLHSTLTHH